MRWGVIKAQGVRMLIKQGQRLFYKGDPIQKFICASNKNKVLCDFFEKGIYDSRREFHITNSPSKDILISSNLERFLFHISGERSDLVARYMEELKEKGYYEITDEMQKNMSIFEGGYADDQTTKERLKLSMRRKVI